MKKILLPLCLTTLMCSPFAGHSLTYPESSECIDNAIAKNTVDPKVYFHGIGRLHSLKSRKTSTIADSTGEYLGFIFADKYNSIVDAAESCDTFMSNILIFLDKEAELSIQIQNTIDQYSQEFR